MENSTQFSLSHFSKRRIVKAILFFLVFFIPSLASALDYYWVNGSGNWSDYTNHWATTAGGGTFHLNVPTASDDVFFTNNGGVPYTVFVNASSTVPKCRNMNWTTAPNGTILDGSTTGRLDIYGSLMLNSNMTITFPGEIHFIAFGSASTITSNGVHFPTYVYFEGTAGGWLLNDAFFVEVFLTHTGGTLMTNDQTVTIGSSSPYSGFRGNSPGRLELGDSEFIINGGSGAFSYAPADFDAGTSHVICHTGGHVDGAFLEPTNSHFFDVTFTHFNPEGLRYASVDGTITFEGNGQLHGEQPYAPPPVINLAIFESDGYIYDAIDYVNLTLTAGKNYFFRDWPGGANGTEQTILPGGTLTANSGTACNDFINLKSYQFGTPVDFINNSGNDITVTGVTVEDVHAIGSNALICNYGLDISNSTGWTFTNQCPALSLYWIGGAGDWDDYAHWSTSSGGATCDCLPSAATNVFFDANSGFSAGNNIVTVAGRAYCADMDWTGVTGMPTINGVIAPDGEGGVLYIYGSLVFASPTEMTYNMPGGTYFRAAGAETITSARQNYLKVTFEGNGSWEILDSLKVLITVHHYDGTIYTLGNPIVCRTWLGNWQSVTYGGYADKGAELWLGVAGGASSTVTLRENELGNFYASYEVGKFHAVESNIVGAGGGYVSTENKNHDFWDVTFTAGAHAGSFVNGNILHKLTYFTGGNLLGNNTTIHEAEFHGNGYIFNNHIFGILTIYGGKTYKLEGGNTTQTITAGGSINLVNASCENPAYLFSPLPGYVATIRKEGVGATLALHDVILDNVFPDLATGATYSAVNSSAIQPSVETAWNMVNGAARSLHWVGGAGNWHDAAHWSLTSGGAGGECPPTPQDDVFFDGGSGLGGAAVTVSQKFAFCKNMDWTGVGSGALFDNTTNGNITDIYGGNNLAVFGNLAFASSMVNDFGGSVFMRGSLPATITSITSAGNHFKHRLLFWNPAGDWSLSDDLWVDFEVQHLYGKLTSNGHDITTGAGWYASGVDPGTELFLGSSTLTILSNNPGYGYGNFFYEPGKLHSGASKIVFENNYPGLIFTPSSYPVEFYDVTFKAPTSVIYYGKINHQLVFEKFGYVVSGYPIHELEFKDDGYLYGIGQGRDVHIVHFAPGKRYTFDYGFTLNIVPFNGQEGQFIAQGLPGQYIELKSSNPNAPAFIHMDDYDGGTTCTQYLFLTGMTHTGSEIIYVPTPGGNVFGNSGWLFAPCGECPASTPVLDVSASVTEVCPQGTAILVLDNLAPGEWAIWYDDPDATNEVYNGGAPGANLFQPVINGPVTFYARVFSDGGQCTSTDILTVNITVTEEICDGIDNDCDGLIDEGFDLDGDGVTSCGGDCDDSDPANYPDNNEICDNQDNDCDGSIDEGFDQDGDGFTVCGGDCNDNNPAINPGASEACNGIDDNCNSMVDEDNVCDEDGDGFTISDGDCDDTNPAIYPGAPELCNGIDDDCDGIVPNEEADADGDNYRICDGDCDDTEASVHPGATEICNGTDDDCNSQIDEGFDQDGDGIANCFDNCPTTSNPSQADSDCDGVGDACDQWPGCDDSEDSDDDGTPDCVDLDEMTNWACGNNGSKVTVCHIPPGNPANRHEICISPNAVPGHLNNHGDYIGECDQVFCPGSNLAAPPGNSIASMIDAEGFQLYPNPASQTLYLDLHNYLEQQLSISIYNHLGQQVLHLPEQELHEPVLSIDLTKRALTNGIYLLTVRTTEGQWGRQFVIAE